MRWISMLLLAGTIVLHPKLRERGRRFFALPPHARDAEFERLPLEEHIDVALYAKMREPDTGWLV